MKKLLLTILVAIVASSNLYSQATTPVINLQLTSMCSDETTVSLRWRVRNTNSFDVSYTYNVYGTSQSGLGLALANTDVFFFTTPYFVQFDILDTIFTANTTKIFWYDENGVQKSTVKASGHTKCIIDNPNPVPQECYGAQVVSFYQGLRKNGTVVLSNRSDSTKALGTPQNTDASNAPINYVSLGFGGEIIIDLGTIAGNGSGDDIAIFETSYGNPSCNSYPERAEVYASLDGSPFSYIYIGTACQNDSFDLGILPGARYIKVHDVSAPASFGGSADGYDLDGIKCLNGAIPPPPPPQLTDCSVQDALEFIQGKSKDGNNVATNRSNKTNAEGVPQSNDTYNFVSLGIGGSLVMKFDYVVFNKPGSDLQVIETSFGNPSCNTYPERAIFYGSLTNPSNPSDWKRLGKLCLDGQLDLGSVYAIQYIRAVDSTYATSYPGSGDGYDIDAIICYDAANADRVYDNISTPDASEGIELAVYPNPASNLINVDFRAQGKTTITLANYLGQVIGNEAMEFEENTATSQLLDLSSFNSGIYFVTVESNYGKETVKVIKN